MNTVWVNIDGECIYCIVYYGSAWASVACMPTSFYMYWLVDKINDNQDCVRNKLAKDVLSNGMERFQKICGGLAFKIFVTIW